MRLVAVLIALATTFVVHAEEIDSRRAHFNYQMFCQGCHTTDGVGANSVPRIKGTIGVFLASQAGREYLVRVPGAASSALNDRDLAEVLNWIIVTFAGESIAGPLEPYTAKEVGQLRRDPLQEIVRHRAKIIRDIAAVNANAETSE